MVIKGILEQITNSTVNLVNADLLAKTRGLRIIESIVPAEGRSVTALVVAYSSFSRCLMDGVGCSGPPVALSVAEVHLYVSSLFCDRSYVHTVAVRASCNWSSIGLYPSTSVWACHLAVLVAAHLHPG